MVQRSLLRAASPEENFLDFVRQIDRHRAGRLCLVVTLHTIDTYRARQSTQNLVCDHIKRHLAGRVFEVFRFDRGDVAVMTKDVTSGMLQDTAFGLIYRLKDEAFFKTFENGEHDLCRILSAETEYDDLLDYARASRAGEIALPHEGQVITVDDDEAAAPQAETEDLASKPGPQWATIEAEDDHPYPEDPDEELSTRPRDFEILRMDVVRLCDGRAPSSELTMMVADEEALAERFLRAADEETRDAYLPKICQEAECQLMERLAQDKPQIHPLLIGASVGTMLSTSFLEFDAARAAAQVWPRGHLLLDRRAARAAGAGVYEFAREFVEGRGYQVSLTGMDIYSLARLQLKAQGFTFQVVEYKESDASFTTRAERQQIYNMLTSGEAAATILTNCNTPEAIEFGREIGVEYFTGRAASAAVTKESYQLA